MRTVNKKPDVIQAFDFYEDREYYKIIKGFFSSSNVKVRSDRLKDWKQWIIECEDLPDEISVNGKEYILLDKSKTK